MVGPRTATISRAPRARIASTVSSITPPTAPFQPACAAPTTLPARSANRTGPQSAVTTPMGRPGTSVTTASARGFSSISAGNGPVAT